MSHMQKILYNVIPKINQGLNSNYPCKQGGPFLKDLLSATSQQFCCLSCISIQNIGIHCTLCTQSLHQKTISDATYLVSRGCNNRNVPSLCTDNKPHQSLSTLYKSHVHHLYHWFHFKQRVMMRMISREV